MKICKCKIENEYENIDCFEDKNLKSHHITLNTH